MLNADQFRDLVIRPTLLAMNMHSDAAENLLLGTAVQESGLRALAQIPTGPARGIYQMEPATHDDIWQNYLQYRDDLSSRVGQFLGALPDRVEQLVTNLAYATAMCRIHYYRAPAALPVADDVDGLARYWKQYYNTPQGHGTAIQFAENYRANA